MIDSDALLQLTDVTKVFSGRHEAFVALAGVSLTIGRETRLGVVGASGSGKSTLARIAVGLERPTSGSVTFNGADVMTLRAGALLEFRRRVQFIAQDTSSSFDPRRSLREAVRRPAQVLVGADRRQADSLVDEAIFQVGLPVTLADRKPHEVSGGQRQRFAIARALIVQPSVIVCDEIVSALDVLVQATVLNIVKDRTEKSAMGLLFVSHGLPATAFISEELAVMKTGRIVERGATNRVLTRAEHPSAMELISTYRDLASNLSNLRRASAK